MIEDYSVTLIFSPCMHRCVTTVQTGGMHFSEGQVWDDIQEKLLCLDCMEYVTEEEVRAAWGQIPLPKQEESDDND